MYSKEEKKRLVQTFWDLFDKYCNSYSELKGRKKKWILYDTGVSRVDLKFDVGRQNARVILEINHRDEVRRLELYEKIEQYKAIIEQDFEEGLIWDFAFLRDNGQEVCRIYTQLDGVDLHRQNQWPEIYQFFAENMLKLERNFLEIRDLLIEE